MVKIHVQNISLGIIPMTIIIAASIVSVISVTVFGNFGIAQGQVSNSTVPSSSSLTPQQKAAICNPNNPKLNFVNSTESKICGIPSTSTNTTRTTPAANNNTTPPTTGKQSGSLLYNQGYTKGVADAKSVQITTPTTDTMSSEAVDCDSDIDPQANNEDYCSGYQHGYADTYNHEVKTNEGK